MIDPPPRLSRSVEKLTTTYTVEHHQRVPGGGRRLVTTTHPSLISMLRNASLSTGGAHAGSAGPTTRSVIDPDAVELTKRLRDTIRGLWNDLVPGIVAAGVLAHNRPTLENALSTWYVLFTEYDRARMIPPDQFDHAARECGRWVHTIEAKFDPVSTRPIHDPCPACHERWVIHGSGILTTRVAALLLTFTGNIDDSSVICRACGLTWVGRAAMHRLNTAIERAR